MDWQTILEWALENNHGVRLDFTWGVVPAVFYSLDRTARVKRRKASLAATAGGVRV